MAIERRVRGEFTEAQMKNKGFRVYDTTGENSVIVSAFQIATWLEEGKTRNTKSKVYDATKSSIVEELEQLFLSQTGKVLKVTATSVEQLFDSNELVGLKVKQPKEAKEAKERVSRKKNVEELDLSTLSTTASANIVVNEASVREDEAVNETEDVPVLASASATSVWDDDEN